MPHAALTFAGVSVRAIENCVLQTDMETQYYMKI